MADPKDIALQLGLLFLAAVVFGRLARFVKVPRVAGYLIGGLIAGPHILGWIRTDVVATLDPLCKFALALIIFEIGTNFEFKRLKRQGGFLIPLMLADIGFAFVLVFVGIGLTGAGLTIALFLAIMAIATAPAATMLVLKEYKAEGDITDSLISIVGVNNFFCIIAFEIALVFFLANQGAEELIPALASSILSIVIAIAIGAVGGVFISYLEQKVTGPERFILFLGVVVVVFGVSLQLGISYLLVFLIMGTVLVNSSEFTEEILGELDKIGWPLYVLFFLIAGSKLNLTGLKSVGMLSLVYLLMRAVGKVGGVNLIARFVKRVPDTARGIGWGLLTQAGLAVGLAMICSQKLGDAGRQLETVIVSTIVVFEVIGAVLVRMTIVRAGEVKIFSLIDRPVISPYTLSLRATARQLLTRLGFGPWETPKRVTELRVKHVMLKNIRTIPIDSTFPEIMSFMSHSRFHNFPVTGADRHYEGIISYPGLREVIYDPRLSHIMIAKDFVRMKDIRVDPESTLSEALKEFNRLNMDCLPVVEEKTNKLVGLLEQREVLRLCEISRNR